MRILVILLSFFSLSASAEVVDSSVDTKMSPFPMESSESRKVISEKTEPVILDQLDAAERQVNKEADQRGKPSNETVKIYRQKHRELHALHRKRH